MLFKLLQSWKLRMHLFLPWKKFSHKQTPVIFFLAANSWKDKPSLIEESAKLLIPKFLTRLTYWYISMSLQTFESVALSLKMDNPASTRIQVSAFKLFSLVNTLPQKMHYVLLNRKLLCSIINLSYESTTNEDDSIIITARSLIITFFCWLTSIMSLMYFMGKWGFLETW